MTDAKKIRKTHGFNLIESAIVLGIIGLIIGGIWLAGATVSEQRIISNLSSATLQTVQNVRNTLKGQTLPHSFTWLHEMLINGKMLPANWTSTESQVIYSENGSWTNLGIEYDPTEYAPSGGYGLVVAFTDKLTDSQCIKLVSSITSRFTDRSDLMTVAIGSSTYLRSFPVDTATITSQCTTRGGNPSVIFVFSI